MASSAAQISFCNTAPASFRKPTFRPSTTAFSGQRLYNTTHFGSSPSSASLKLSGNNCNGWSIGPFGMASEKVTGIYLGNANSAFGAIGINCSRSSSFHCFAQKTARSVSVNAQSDTAPAAGEERVVVLVIGGGGREHALCYAMKRSPSCDAVFCAPGNAGISNAGDATCIPDLDVFDSSAVISFCRKWDVGLVVVGPEAPLVSGIVNDLVKAGIPAFGPSSEASALEGSKNFMKSLCDKYGIPTAKYKTFTDASNAKQYIQEQGAPIVIKADGLAAGKGVIVAMTLEEAYEAVDSMLVKGVFGSAGFRVIVEEYLEGEEASFFALVDGENAIPLQSAQDHKRVGDGDTGPNTGGMGAYSPAPVLTKELQDLVMKSIILPTVKGMSAEGCKFVGVLYAGLMIQKKSGLPKLIEYNVRFGDPECQVLMVRLECDLAQVLLAACRGRLSEVSLNWSPGSAMVVVMASKGYPGSYQEGSLIQNLDEAENIAPSVKIFHAGTAQDSEGNYVAIGGRVLGVTAKGKDLQEARDRAYQAVEAIDWSGGFYRRDIGWRALPEKQFVTKA
ncbi:phosphoribosylamine--glycine ligase [Ziziphus jujuba]|uniref:phosphoribosylamine--glycine ligase n=1 Tax=Ziziphus jujuba TaxID=326968 RepID=A0A6P3ZRM3_ZIZJJ|nr:phosphoribosylamine--glycine ligase [Ziziphus jujuba]